MLKKNIRNKTNKKMLVLNKMFGNHGVNENIKIICKSVSIISGLVFIIMPFCQFLDIVSAIVH